MRVGEGGQEGREVEIMNAIMDGGREGGRMGEIWTQVCDIMDGRMEEGREGGGRVGGRYN